MSGGHRMVPGDSRILPRRRLLIRFLTEGGVPFTMTRVNIIKGPGPVLQIAEGWSVELPKAMHDQLDARTNSTAYYGLRRVLPAKARLPMSIR